MTPVLVTRTGDRYSPYSRSDLTSFASVVVGQATTAMVAFEVPRGALTGARFEVAPHQPDGISGVLDTATFTLPESLPISAGPVVVVASITEAGR